MFNVPVDPNRPAWRMYHTTYVTCALCRRRIKRQKFDEHLAKEHPDYESDKGEIIDFSGLRKTIKKGTV